MISGKNLAHDEPIYKLQDPGQAKNDQITLMIRAISLSVGHTFLSQNNK
jgi:hypothetical protein